MQCLKTALESLFYWLAVWKCGLILSSFGWKVQEMCLSRCENYKMLTFWKFSMDAEIICWTIWSLNLEYKREWFSMNRKQEVSISREIWGTWQAILLYEHWLRMWIKYPKHLRTQMLRLLNGKNNVKNVNIVCDVNPPTV